MFSVRATVRAIYEDPGGWTSPEARSMYHSGLGIVIRQGDGLSSGRWVRVNGFYIGPIGRWRIRRALAWRSEWELGRFLKTSRQAALDRAEREADLLLREHNE